MTRRANSHGRACAAAAVAVVAAALVGFAAPEVAEARQRATPGQLWAIEVDRASIALLTPRRVAQLRRAGVNAIVADPHRLSPRQLRRVAGFAARRRFTVLVPNVVARATPTGAADAAAACRKRRSRGRPCVVAVETAQAAAAAAAFEDIDAVLLRLGRGQNVASVRRLADGLASSSPAARIVLLAPLDSAGRATNRSLRLAIAAVERNVAVDLSVAPTRRWPLTLGPYLRALRSSRVPLPISRGRGTKAPRAPRIVAASARSIEIAWARPVGRRPLEGYVLYRGTSPVGATRARSATFYRLRCGTTYRLGVAAVDRTRTGSRPTTVVATTGTCAGGSPADGPAAPGPGPAPGPGGSGGTTPSAPGPHQPPAATPPGGSPPPLPPGPPGTLLRSFVAPSGLNANPCTQPLPCAAFGRAYQAAAPGATVEIAGGAYPAQEIVDDPSKAAGPPVVFEPAGGAGVSTPVLDLGRASVNGLGPKNVTVRNLKADLIRTWPGSSNIAWENIDGRIFGVFDATNVRISGGDFGPCQAPRDGNCVSYVAGTSANVTLDGIYIHDITSTDLVNYHVDGVFLRGGDNVTISRSKFRGNMITNIRLQNQPCCSNGTVAIENNWFAPPLTGDGVTERSDAIDVDNPVGNLLIRNNSFAQNAGPLVLAGGARLVGNLMVNLGCVSGVTYSYNLFIPYNDWTGQSPCGPTDKKVTSFGYVSAGDFEYRITAASPANGAGAPGDCPAVDFEGQSRSDPCDAGSDER